MAPQPALTAADHAVITREMARAAAHRLGHRVIFSPKPDPDLVGNGVHIHMSLWDEAGRPATYGRRRENGSEQTGAAFLCRCPAPYAGDLRANGALASLVSAADAQCLGADPDRSGAARPRRRSAHLPGLRRREPGRNRAPIQCRVSRVRRVGQPLSGAGRGNFCRGRRDPPGTAVAGGGCDAILPARPRSARRSTFLPRARLPRNGSAQSIATPICASSGSRRRRSQHYRRPSCALITPKYTDPMPRLGHSGARLSRKPGTYGRWMGTGGTGPYSWFPDLLLRSIPE